MYFTKNPQKFAVPEKLQVAVPMGRKEVCTHQHRPAHTSSPTSTHINTHINTTTSTHINTHKHTHQRTSTHTSAHSNTHQHTHQHTPTHIQQHSPAHTSTHTSTHTPTPTRTHTNTQQHTHQRPAAHTSTHASTQETLESILPYLCEHPKKMLACFHLRNRVKDADLLTLKQGLNLMNSLLRCWGYSKLTRSNRKRKRIDGAQLGKGSTFSLISWKNAEACEVYKSIVFK